MRVKAAPQFGGECMKLLIRGTSRLIVGGENVTEDSEFGKGFADDHDDWGMNVNPEKLNI